jgi:alkylation response protein AidB-like acyl-CoA dehydrogenase
VEKLKRDVRITCIYEGTSEILQRTIARDRWRLHLQTQGRYYADLAAGLDGVEKEQSASGAAAAASAARALREILEACRLAHLTRNQHVLFSLGSLCANVEVAAAFARKAASGQTDTSRNSPATLRAMSRLWARRTARQVLSEGLALVAGGNALAGPALREFERRLHPEGIHDAYAGEIEDLGLVAGALTAN